MRVPRSSGCSKSNIFVTGPAAPLRMGRTAGAGKRRVGPGAALAVAGEHVGRSRRLIHDLAELMIVPAVGVVIVDEDSRRTPLPLLLKEVDDLHDEFLLVEGVGIAGVRI